MRFFIADDLFSVECNSGLIGGNELLLSAPMNGTFNYTIYDASLIIKRCTFSMRT